ncbi:uncharacterized protein BDCG_02427 [Blastomyces dermatitidis ER-3]|uniref:Uncharacterized protein n=1 Tax=Ajellomyces dermatitidis (strain ER-3 / ATCC MYA-2586) TaxID=559297 RepID=A0ABP2ETU4_AJEDR|nr:uncharacterized protein BDCG_02427 [Blastomyces dermatitidis ER-3]EEQ87307.2 hypothetical protein BDCG_02427 [Blastomyces dermatitidis ER-3]
MMRRMELKIPREQRRIWSRDHNITQEAVMPIRPAENFLTASLQRAATQRKSQRNLRLILNARAASQSAHKPTLAFFPDSPIVSVTIGAACRRYLPRRARNIPSPPLLISLEPKRESPEQHVKKQSFLSPFARQWADKRRLSRTPPTPFVLLRDFVVLGSF